MKIIDKAAWQIYGGIMDKFKATFIKDGIGFRDKKGARNLLWCHINEKYQQNSVLFKTKNLPKVIDFSLEDPIYIYFDRTEELYQATISDFFQYISAIEKWQTEDVEFDKPWSWSFDAEIFDETLEWAMCVTHEDVTKLLGFEPERLDDRDIM